MLPILRRWLTVLTIFYLAGGFASWSTLLLIDKFTEPRNLLAKIRPGLAPADVKATIGRSPEYRHNYACVPDCGPFSHNWTISGHRVEVIFDRSGRVERVFAYRRDPGRIERFIGWVYFWWVSD
jgi:hypothetical protein